MGSSCTKRETVFIEKLIKLFMCTILLKSGYTMLDNLWFFFVYLSYSYINFVVMNGGGKD